MLKKYFLLGLSALLLTCSSSKFLHSGKHVMKGVNYANYLKTIKDLFSSLASDNMVGEICEWGANSISIVSTHYVDRLGSTHIRNDYAPSKKSLRHVIDMSKKCGLEIMIKPHIDVLDGSSRTDINFNSESDWKSWFDNYKRIISHHLGIAQSDSVSIFCIGTELDKTAYREEWLDLIDYARSMFRGKLTYASHDFNTIPFWDKLDYIGVDFYPSIKVRKDNFTSEDIETRLRYCFDDLAKYSHKLKKPILITEWGFKYKSPDNEKWDWISDSSPDKNQQVMYYNAFTNVLKEYRFAGSFLWVCHPPSKYYHDKFCPGSSDAVNVLKNFFDPE